MAEEEMGCFEPGVQDAKASPFSSPLLATPNLPTPPKLEDKKGEG